MHDFVNQCSKVVIRHHLRVRKERISIRKGLADFLGQYVVLVGIWILC